MASARAAGGDSPTLADEADQTDSRYAQPLLPVLHLLDGRLNEYSGILVTFERLSVTDLARLIALGLTEKGLHDGLIAVATWMNDPNISADFLRYYGDNQG